jgi:hypothetical protein
LRRRIFQLPSVRAGLLLCQSFRWFWNFLLSRVISATNFLEDLMLTSIIILYSLTRETEKAPEGYNVIVWRQKTGLTGTSSHEALTEGGSHARHSHYLAILCEWLVNWFVMPGSGSCCLRSQPCVCIGYRTPLIVLHPRDKG